MNELTKILHKYKLTGDDFKKMDHYRYFVVSVIGLATVILTPLLVFIYR